MGSDKRVMLFIQQYLIILFHICCIIMSYAADHDIIDDEELSSSGKNLRFADILLKLSDEQVAQEYSEIYQKRAELNRPQALIYKQIHLLDKKVQEVYEQRVEIDKQLVMKYAYQSQLETKRDTLTIKVDDLIKVKERLTKRLKEYGKDEDSQDTECKDELSRIMMSSDRKQLEHCTSRIAFMCKEMEEFDQQRASLSFEIRPLEAKRDQWIDSLGGFHKERVGLEKLQLAYLDDQIKPLFDNFDELLELAIVTAYASPSGIFDRLVEKAACVEQCAWCISLLKVFEKAISPTTQEIIGHIRNKKSYCHRQIRCNECNHFSIKRDRVFSTIAETCLQQLKYDRCCRICSLCSSSMIGKEKLLQQKTFVACLESIIPKYLKFRLHYVELFQKQDVNMHCHLLDQHSIVKDLLYTYHDQMQILKKLLDDKGTIHYLQGSVKQMDNPYDAFDCFLTKKELSEKTFDLLSLSQIQINRMLDDLRDLSCQSSSSSSSSINVGD